MDKKRALGMACALEERADPNELMVLGLEVDLTSRFVYDKTKQGWQIKGDAEFRTAPLRLEFSVVAVYLADDEELITGSRVVDRALEMGVWTGQRTLEALEKQQHLIPKEFRGRVRFLGPGTFWKPIGGYSQFAELAYAVGSWRVGWRKLSEKQERDARMLKLRAKP